MSRQMSTGDGRKEGLTQRRFSGIESQAFLIGVIGRIKKGRTGDGGTP